MRRLAQIISFIALACTLLPAMLFFGDILELPQVKAGMLLAALAWFASAPFWMERLKS